MAVQTFRIAGLVTNWPWRRRPSPTQELPRERAAARVEAYVYGNVLVLAAVITAGTAEVASGRAALIALGTAASTFIAHLLAMLVGQQAEIESGPHHLAEGARDGLPMATSGVWPGIALAAGWLGWLHPDVAWYLAVGILGLRFLALGSVVAYLKGVPSSWRNLAIGVALAVAALLVATLKNLLTH